jgi:protein-S-isoprenylcysteine O-methyltransferase Ste14
MQLPPPDPRYAADLLIVAFATLKALRWRRGDSLRTRSSLRVDRGTTAVLIGCYGIALLAIHGYAPSLVSLPHEAEWCGIALSAAGLALHWWAERLLRPHHPLRSAPGELRRGPYRVVRYPDYLGNIAFWSGVTMASGNLIATITLVVALLASYAVRISSEEALRGRAGAPAH